MTIFAFYTEMIPSQQFHNITNNELVIVCNYMEVMLLSDAQETKTQTIIIRLKLYPTITNAMITPE